MKKKTIKKNSTSNDNPFSESQFKTLKYHPGFPKRFRGMEEARGFCRSFFAWYNGHHRHGGIAMLTPNAVHDGEAQKILDARQLTMDLAFPERSALCAFDATKETLFLVKIATGFHGQLVLQ